MVARRGASAIGCLFALLGMALVVYLSFHIGTAYLGRFRFEQQMKQEILFAGRRTDDEIKARLKAWADSGGYPPEAGNEIGILRTSEHVRVWSDYEHELRIPVFGRALKFHPSAEGQL